MNGDAQVLISRAAFVGHDIITEHGVRKTLPEFTRFFDSDLNELGYIFLRGDPQQTVKLFDPPRVWGAEALNNLASGDNTEKKT